MVGASAWQRLSAEGRAGRRADGPALMADLMSVRGGPPFDVRPLAVPAVFGMGAGVGASHRRAAVIWLGRNVPSAGTLEIEGAEHGAHLAQPDHFSEFTRAVVGRALSAQVAGNGGRPPPVMD